MKNDSNVRDIMYIEKAQDGDVEAIRALVEKYTPLIENLSSSVLRSLPKALHLERADIQGELTRFTIELIPTFDSTKNVKWITYLIGCLDRFIKSEYRTSIHRNKRIANNTSILFSENDNVDYYVQCCLSGIGMALTQASADLVFHTLNKTELEILKLKHEGYKISEISEATGLCAKKLRAIDKNIAKKRQLADC